MIAGTFLLCLLIEIESNLMLDTDRQTWQGPRATKLKRWDCSDCAMLQRALERIPKPAMKSLRRALTAKRCGTPLLHSQSQAEPLEIPEPSTANPPLLPCAIERLFRQLMQTCLLCPYQERMPGKQNSTPHLGNWHQVMVLMSICDRTMRRQTPDRQ